MSELRRFDIQILENRVQKLKEQLSEGQYKKFYSGTRDRLKSVESDLEMCLDLIQNMISSGSTSSSYSGSENFQVKDDSADIGFELFSGLEFSSSMYQLETYTPKFIMSTFRKKFESFSEISTGILQVNQVCKMIQTWFDTRYSFSDSNSKFRYKADKVPEWIDLIILASGYYLHTNMFGSFRSEFDEWIEMINTDRDKNWILPKNIMKFHKATPLDFTEEALLIERIVKYYLYDDSFYPGLKDSIERIVIQSERFGTERLSTEHIIEDCKGSWVVTSTFDMTRY